MNWKLEFPPLAPGLSFTAGELTGVMADTDWAIYVCTMAADSQSFAEAWVDFRDIILESDSSDPPGPLPNSTVPDLPAAPKPPRGIIHRFQGYIQRVKTAPGYNATIGAQLRILPTVPAPVDLATVKPDLRGEALAMFQARLRWTRRDFGGIELQSQRDGDADWVSLGVKTATTVLDARPPVAAGKPEVRRYRAIYLLDDSPVGQWSDVVSVTVQP